MQVNPGIFKAYDIRGIYPSDLNEDAAYAIGRAFVTFLRAEQVLVGRDMRLSGPQIFDAVTRGIMLWGALRIDVPAPTWSTSAWSAPTNTTSPAPS